MNSKKINGFTLIELLAVIIILGVLMLTAIPAVTKYIENSRKDTFAQTAKSYIEAARSPLLNGEYVVKAVADSYSDIHAGDECDLPPVGKADRGGSTYYYTAIDIKDVELEKGKGKSAFNRDFGKNEGDGYIVIVNYSVVNTMGFTDQFVEGKMEYFFIGIDAGKNGVSRLTKESDLKRNSVKKGNGAETGEYGIASVKAAITGGNDISIQNEAFSTFKFYQYCGM